VKGGNQYLCLNEKVQLLRHSYTILWYWYGITGLIDKPRCGKCVDYNRILWHEKSAKKPQQTWVVNKSHSNQIALKTFGSTRTGLALNEQRRLNTSVHNAKVIYTFHWGFLQLPAILMVSILDWITVCIVDVHTGTSVGQGGSNKIEGNGNLRKTKKSLPIMLATVQQPCWPQKIIKETTEHVSQFDLDIQ